ncbi:BamA/TamA family outer membrane protein [candidate division KSB1 bacterium]|nr:BamA/TamA family outer membrane protein [candidate division KSB1 bacterium]
MKFLLRKQNTGIRSLYHTRRFFLLCLIITLISASAFSQEGYEVDRIEFSGNQSFSSGKLAENLTLTAKRGLARIKFWQKPKIFHANRLQSDVHALIMFYQREGFIQVEVQPVVDKDEQNKSLQITYIINEGSPVMIDSVSFSFRSDPQRLSILQAILAKVKSDLKSRSNVRFRDQMIQDDMGRITTAFNNEGYAYTEVKIRPQLSPDQFKVDLTFEIDVGPVCHFGHVAVLGDSALPVRLIRKQVTFQPGQLYSQELLERTQRQIYQLGFFQFVTVKVLLDSTRRPVLPVRIHTQLARKLTVKVGAGYSREDEIRVFLNLRRLRFLGGARRLEFYAKHSKLEPFHMNTKLYQAAFPFPRASLSINPFYLRQQEPGFSVDRLGAHMTLQQRFATFTDGYLNYTLEQDQLRASEAVRAVALDSSKISLYHKSTVHIGLAHDDSKPIFNPETGNYYAVNLSFSGLGFQSDFHYFKAVVEARHYWQLKERQTLAARLKIGSMEPLYDDPFTPIEDRFFAGGSMSMRGWEYAQVGPKDWTGKPVGGNSMLEANCEWRYPLLDPISGVFFVDAGNVWSRVHGHRLDQIRVAGGWGLRFRTPIGPIRLDFATPVGEGKKPLQIHLSVGQAF